MYSNCPPPKSYASKHRHSYPPQAPDMDQPKKDIEGLRQNANVDFNKYRQIHINRKNAENIQISKRSEQVPHKNELQHPPPPPPPPAARPRSPNFGYRFEPYDFDTISMQSRESREEQIQQVEQSTIIIS